MEPRRSMELAIGPLLFNWAPERVEAFYARIADEAPVATVYLGEVVCGKRQPLLQHALARSAERLEAAGCEVVTYKGAEISRKGEGGPTCLTRPLEREA